MCKAMCLLAILCFAAVTDLKTGKIRNVLILIGLLSGLGFSVIYRFSCMESLCGMLLPMILYPFFCLRLIGAGDVKLLTVIGCYLGYRSFCKAAAGILIGIVVWAMLYFLIQYRFHRTAGEGLLSFLHRRFPMAPGMLLGMAGYYLLFGF